MADDAAPKRLPNYDIDVPSLEGRVSPEEWRARVDLAACYRLIDLYGMSDTIANHISVRVPGEPDHYLLNPYGMLYDEITASTLLKINLDGEVISQPPFDYGVNRAGFIIHSAVHAARHDVDCVIHTHTAAGMAVSALSCGLLPITQTGMRFAHVAYHDYEGVVLNLEEQARLVANLGQNDLLILRNHGLLVVGQTVPQAFNAMHRAELACRSQIMAMSCGVELICPPPQVVEETFMNYQPQVRRPFGVLDWPAMLRKLDKIDTSYRH